MTRTATVTEVAEGLHRLSRGVVNFYLIEEQGKFSLVDAGTPGDWAFFLETLSGFGRRLPDLDAVLLTHAHSDHTGFAERARSTGGATVRVHRDDVAVARGGKQPGNDGKVTSYLFKAELYRTTFSLLRRGAVRIVPVQEVSAFDDGETLAVPGRPRVIHAPGHTAGSAALLLEGRRALFTGDVLATWNPLTGRIGPQICPSGLNWNTPKALESLRVFEGVEADAVLPGHGEPWRGGMAEALRLARAAAPS